MNTRRGLSLLQWLARVASDISQGVHNGWDRIWFGELP